MTQPPQDPRFHPTGGTYPPQGFPYPGQSGQHPPTPAPQPPQQPHGWPQQPGMVPPQQQDYGGAAPQPQFPANPQLGDAQNTVPPTQQPGGLLPPTATQIPPSGAPQQLHSPQPQQPRPAQKPQPDKTPWYKKPTNWIIAALAVSVVIFLIGVGAMLLQDDEESSTDAASAAQTPLATEHEVTYRLLGDSADAAVTYNNGQSSNGQEQGIGAGWELTTTVSNTFGAYLFATNGIDQEGELICQIEANGVIISENSTTGPLTDASCNPTNAELAAAFGD